MYRLRGLERKDLKKINTWRNDEEIISLLGASYCFINQEVDEKWYEGYIQSLSNAVRCAIVTEECDDIIGLVSLCDINFINRSAKLHIMIGSEGQGKGAGTFAVKAMCEHAFKNYGLHRIELNVLSENKRAQHVYEKCGFIQEGIRKQVVYKNGKYSDMLSYALLNNDNNVQSVQLVGGLNFCWHKFTLPCKKNMRCKCVTLHLQGAS